jgi:hypothetical protein
MPVGALLAPLAAEAIIPALGGADALGALGVGGLTAGLGGLFGAGSGALFSEISGGDPGKGALAGGIGGLATEGGALAGPALGLSSTAGATIGGALGGGLGGLATGTNPLLGAAEGGATGLIGGAIGGQTGAGAPGTGAAATVGSTGLSSAGPSAVGVTDAPISDPNALLNQSGNTNFLGATGGTTNISGVPTGNAPGGSAISGGSNVAGGPTDFLNPGTDDPLLGGISGGSSSQIAPDFSSKLQSLLGDPKSLLAALPLLMGSLQGGSQLPAEQQLAGQAKQSSNQAQALEAPLQTGQLPPGAQQAIDASTRSQKAGIASTFANLGLTGSTMELQAKQAVDRGTAAQTFQIADSLLSKGLVAQGQSQSAYSDLLRSQMAQDQMFQQALAKFAAGLAGGGNSGA